MSPETTIKKCLKFVLKSLVKVLVLSHAISLAGRKRFT